MYAMLQSHELKLQARRLRSYRILLITLLAADMLLMLRAVAHSTGYGANDSASPSAQQASTTELPEQAVVATPSSEADRAYDTETTEVAEQVSSRAGLLIPATALPASTASESVPTASQSTIGPDVPPPAAGHAIDPPSYVADAPPTQHPVPPEVPTPSEPDTATRTTLQLDQVAQHVAPLWQAVVQSARPRAAWDLAPSATSARPPTVTDTTPAAESEVAAPHAEDTAGSPTADQLFSTTGITIENPVENDCTIRFLLDGHPMVLHPGQSQCVALGDTCLIQYHPGGDYEDVAMPLCQGTYRFVATSHGWTLLGENP